MPNRTGAPGLRYGKIVRTLAIAGMVSGTACLAAGHATAAPDAAIVVDAKSGKVLHSQNPDASRHPASLTKMMTLYMLFEMIDSGRASLSTDINVSSHCAGQAPSKLGFKPGQKIGAKDAILALVTKSANDVACAIGEHISGTESAFARDMTGRAHRLGMKNTTFRNASGLPNDAQVTTARDMATLGRALQDHFPAHFGYFDTKSFKWKGNTYGNHNRLLGRVKGVNGIKTGYTRASGFNLVASVKRGDREIVAVVLGGDTGKSRDAWMENLIEKYLPKATRGERTVAMVQGGPDGIVTFGVVPIPPRRPQPSQPIATASVVGANSIFALAAVDTIEQGDASMPEDAEAFSTEQMVTERPVAQPIAPAAPQTSAPVVVAVAAAPPPAKTAPAPAAPPRVVSGWKIQLAAVPTEESAVEILNNARAKAPQVLASASPYTEAVVKEDVTLYRARFAGFSDKDEARAACAHLTKKEFACLALSN
jgi:D-alanyl-D-alanine carboxypeptidase